MADKLEGHDFASGASIPYPEDDGALWDRVVIGPHILPGTWTVRGSSKRKVDVKSNKGSDGARFRDQGYIPGQFTISGDLIGASDWNEMVKIAKILTPRNRGVAMEPLAVEHPTFTFLGITNVLVLEVLAPVLDGGKVRSTIMVTEWLPRPKKKKKAIDKPIAQRALNRGATNFGGDDQISLRGLTFRNISPSTDTPTYFGGPISP